MDDLWLTISILSLIIGLITRIIYKSKGRPGLQGFFLGFFLGGIGLVIAILTPKEEGIFGKRKCPYCSERIRPEAKICKHCRMELSPAFNIPNEYRLEQLPTSQARSILRKSPDKNLKSAKRLIKKKELHRAIATLQAIIDNAPESSKSYEQAYAILCEIFN